MRAEEQVVISLISAKNVRMGVIVGVIAVEVAEPVGRSEEGKMTATVRMIMK
jgi:hypothetical protein